MSETDVSAEAPLSNPGVQTEARDANTRGVLTFAGVLTLVLLLSHGLVWWLFNDLDNREEGQKRSRFPLAAAGDELPPAPRLEGLDRVEGVENRVPADVKLKPLPGLDQYRWVDEKAGVAQMPIDQAVKLIVEQNLLPTRSSSPGEKKTP